jgi:hypothetical protein
VRANRFSEIDDLGVAAFAQINYVDRASISAGLANAGVSINGNVGEVVVRGHHDFVAINVYADFVYDFSRIDVHDESGVVSLIGYKEKAVRVRRRGRRDYWVVQ